MPRANPRGIFLSDLDTFLATADATKAQAARLNALQTERAQKAARVAELDAMIAVALSDIGAQVSTLTVQLVKAQDTLGQIATPVQLQVTP